MKEEMRKLKIEHSQFKKMLNNNESELREKNDLIDYLRK
jgi:hypothetical protein